MPERKRFFPLTPSLRLSILTFPHEKNTNLGGRGGGDTCVLKSGLSFLFQAT